MAFPFAPLLLTSGTCNAPLPRASPMKEQLEEGFVSVIPAMSGRLGTLASFISLKRPG